MASTISEWQLAALAFISGFVLGGVFVMALMTNSKMSNWW